MELMDKYNVPMEKICDKIQESKNMGQNNLRCALHTFFQNETHLFYVTKNELNDVIQRCGDQDFFTSVQRAVLEKLKLGKESYSKLQKKLKEPGPQ